MANKRTPQILSPENYIRQRARNLPLFQCYINDDWKESGLVQITIARKHINGNLTFCSYLVDIQCLGIKDTFYEFNIPEEGLEEYLEQQRTILNIVEVDYNLAHNIIHAGWEYAEEIGFKPHKDFLTTTQYMLEEDTDEIPIIDIHCGDEDGKPLYIQGPWEDQAKTNYILNHLEKTVGEGNYHIIMAADNEFGEDVDKYLSEKFSDYEDWKKSYMEELKEEEEIYAEEADDEDWDDEDWDDEDWDDEDDEDRDEEDEEEEEFFEKYEAYIEEFAENSFEENRQLFFNLTQFLDNSTFDENEEDEDESYESMCRLEALIDLLYDGYVDEKEMVSWFKKWIEEINHFEVTEKAFAQMLGIPDGNLLTDEDIKYLQSAQNDKKTLKFIDKKWGNIPYYGFLELAQMESHEKQKRKLEDLMKKYPDSAILRTEKIMLKIEERQLEEEDLDFKTIFGQRDQITPFEYQRLLLVRMTYFLSSQNMSGIESMYSFLNYIDEYGINDDGVELIRSVLLATRIALLKDILEKKEDQS